MLGFHRRTRSLIPVKDLAKYDKVPMIDEEELEVEVEMDEGELEDATSKARQRQLILVFVVFLAEAYVTVVSYSPSPVANVLQHYGFIAPAPAPDAGLG